MFSIIFLIFLFLITLTQWTLLLSQELLKAPIFINLNLADFENIQLTDVNVVNDSSVLSNTIDVPTLRSSTVTASCLTKTKFMVLASLCVIAMVIYKVRVWLKTNKKAKNSSKSKGYLINDSNNLCHN